MKRLETDKLWTEVDDYIDDRFLPADPVLDAALKASRAAGLPAINVAPNQGKLLMLLAQLIGARRILEIGTLGGYSTIWLVRGLAPGGRLVTLEANAKYAEVARANIARAGFSDKVDVRVGKAADTLPGLAAEAPFDLIFIDADKEGTPGYFQWAVKLARQGALIIVDNVVREGAILDISGEDSSVQGMRRFFELAATDPRVSGTAIQTVGAKGHDGIAVLLVTAGR
ncbi:MAG TPA: O-methyltransferase [Methyloceanibacter sp.]|jgi:predicted O-methyltransferase YrrM|nr:O-methyltransferase [Methyloceanibacter sp.]